MINSGPGLSPELTVHLVRGRVSEAEVLEAAKVFLKGQPTRLSLWDFREADFSGLQVSALAPFFNAIFPYIHIRKGGKTALVFGSTEGFGLGRMCEALAEVRQFPVRIKSFNSREEARRWLLIRESENGDDEGEGVA
jgi:hypothetical protein